MPFSINDFQDLIRLLGEHPDWRAELRRHVLSEELLALPETMRALAEAQARTEQRLEQLAARVGELTVRLEQVTARVDQLAARVDELTVRLEQLTARVDQLALRMDELAQAQIRLEQAMAGMAVALAELRGHDLERRYRERPFDFFGRLIRRAHALTQEELDRWLEGPVAAGALTEDEADEILLADAVVRGRRKPDGAEVYLVVEGAATLDTRDVARALRRANLLRRAGVTALPVVAGPAASEDAQRAAREAGVAWLADGTAHLPGPSG